MIFLLRSFCWSLAGSCVFTLPMLQAQPAAEPEAIPRSSGSAVAAPLPPSDVLTPNTRQNTPAIKVGTRIGFNRASYTNDRYLDNVALDVGTTSGEMDVYTSAAGFGLQGGIDVEYPMNTGLSLLGTMEVDYVQFSGTGAVQEDARNSDGATVSASSVHSFTASINYLKIAGSAKLNFPSFYTVFGLAAAYPLSTTLSRERTLVNTTYRYPGTDTHMLEDGQGGIPDPTSIHYSLRTAVGLAYQINDKLQFSPELTLDFGFNAINKSRESDLGVYGVNAVFRYDL